MTANSKIKIKFVKSLGMSFINKANVINSINAKLQKSNSSQFISNNNTNEEIRKSKISGE